LGKVSTAAPDHLKIFFNAKIVEFWHSLGGIYVIKSYKKLNIDQATHEYVQPSLLKPGCTSCNLRVQTVRLTHMVQCYRVITQVSS